MVNRFAERQDGKRTRIQIEKTDAILEAALDVFSGFGFRGSTLDQIAERAQISKPNLLYYFSGKEAIHRELLSRLLDTWLQPLRSIDPSGHPIDEIAAYVRRKIEMARDYPREGRLFANEIIHGAPVIHAMLSNDLKALVDEKCEVISNWAAQGRIAAINPHHLIFSIWATTQHYADYSVQVRLVLGRDNEAFDDATVYLDTLFRKLLAPNPVVENHGNRRN